MAYLCLLFQCTSLCEIPQNDQQHLAPQIFPQSLRQFHHNNNKLQGSPKLSSKSPCQVGVSDTLCVEFIHLNTHQKRISGSKTDGWIWRWDAPYFEGRKPGAKVIVTSDIFRVTPLHHVTPPEKNEHNIESLKMMVWEDDFLLRRIVVSGSMWSFQGVCSGLSY